jgi:hypothetical protein
MLTDRYAFASERFLLAAVMDIYDMWAGERASGTRKHSDGPGSDDWSMSTRFGRPVMVTTVAERWSEITGRSIASFPFHDDFVATAWVDYRKESPAGKQELREKLGSEVSSNAAKLFR